MIYATTYHSGYNPSTPRSKAKAIAPPVKGVYGLDRAGKGRKRSPKGQTAARTSSHVANGFLRASFLPKLAETKTVQACTNTLKTEIDFYQSLCRLAEHYCIEPLQTQAFGYPYNIALALQNLELQLKSSVSNFSEIKLLQDSRKTYLTVEERYNTGSTLYYIPIVPLYRLLKNPKRKAAALLLLSTCTYLYHIAGVPYYGQENSYLYWQYEMLEEWVVSDDDGEDTIAHLSELEQAKWIGKRMEQKIYNVANLDVFQQRISQFKGNDTLDKDCLKLAREAFSLFEQYPHEPIFRNAQANGGTDDEDEDDDYMVSMDRYVSFCADAKGWLGENLIECVNTNLQEYGIIEEPAITKCFDGSDITACNLDFENRLFDLINELIYILHNF